MQTCQPSHQASLLVACLCAQWCTTCRDYQSIFSQAHAVFPQVRFMWVDIEDRADLVDPVEVENFPTLLIAQPSQALFFGTITPQAQTLHRLTAAYLASPSRSPQTPDEIDELVRRLWQMNP
jgi:thiol-disulfide isomerase/thioredoxin